ncbi:Ubiquitin recognition factor in ER-associated degradation protein 1 [Phytophthora citrophthora]|uniref:Ubiquitin recognition factor in ER-associated degradation protein 1 n=1 Tax=Phytophthora citrophthora TaxID=4793 RepID=A0AAD9LAL4_9STRA|nr:Ubiquitin recognition factor in ER-associated degradation protein 1 [Phytophthora citrophthora]KAK1931694.1 Ubiquitin recognition factor in ER-associated degradation protein 1 [Phytophthora citrophthora]
MELDLNARSAKWSREQNKRREQAKRKIETERRKRVAAAKAREELEKLQKQKRIERIAELERQEQQALEEQRLTGGIKYIQKLRPVPTSGDGDKITLPVSALEELNPQNALELGVFTFELSFDEEEVIGETLIATRKTHAGVLEFVAEEGTVGIPPKVAASLFRHSKHLPGDVQVRFVRLEKGTFASLQPRGEGFGDRQIDFKHMLERSLKAHTTLTEGDVLLVRHGRETFEVLVAELKPEKAVNILNTDLEVDMIPCEAVAKEKEAEKRLEEEAARAIALAQEKEQLKADKMANLAPEPPVEERLQAKVVLRMAEGQFTRRFAHSSPLRSVFDFVEALTGEEAQQFQLAASYPRRLFAVDAADKSLQELGLNGRQEALFVEKLAADEVMAEPVAKEEENAEQFPGEWVEARQTLESWLDASLHSTAVPAIHALEPAMPVVQSADQETKWQAQLIELEEMGFMNRSLNIEVLERYRGRLLRVVNFLSEMGSAAEADNGVTVMED